MGVSTIPGFKAALFEALKDLDLDAVDIRYGIPADWDIGEIQVALADVEADEEAAAIGRGKRTETPRMDVYLFAREQDPDAQQITTEKAFGIAEEINQVLDQDPTLDAYYDGPGQILWSGVSTSRLDESANETQTHATLLLVVSWSARI